MASISGGIAVLFTLVIAVASQASPMCEDIYPPSNSKVVMHRYNAYYIVRCEPGYIIKDNANILVKCINGQWENPPPKCVQNPDAKVCPDLAAPENGVKICPEGRMFVGSHCRFNCDDGYKLQGAPIRHCMRNLRWSGLSPKCIIETNVTCPVPSPLKNGRIYGCSPKKPPKVGKTCFFHCNDGYVLQGPSALHCQPSGKLLDIDEIESSPKCIASESSLLLDIQGNDSPDKKRFHDSKDKNDPEKVSEPYSNSVHSSAQSRTSRLPSRRTRHQHNTTTCQENNGGCQHTCEEKRLGVICKCPDGFDLAADRKSCNDVDECSEEILNRCQQICNNTLGSYTCSCYHGYRKADKYKCEGCSKDSYWLEEENRCVECPENSVTDSEGKLYIEDCLCLPGYAGNPKESVSCQDIDECAERNFGCSHKCVNTPGSVFCSCPAGFTLDRNNKTCIDIDECSIKNGGCQEVCHNTEGSFYCSCPPGYTPSNKDQYSCDDVDECLENNGDCAQKCNNYPGGHYCSCEAGYRINSGLQNCSDIRCPTLTIPHYSTMTCKLKKSALPLLESYPSGSVCNFACAAGFKITSSNKMKCKDDGLWTGTLPECKSQRCPALDIPENGNIHPPSCARRGNSVKQKCTFTCNHGYNLKGKSVFTCKNDLTWSVKEIPECQGKIHPTIECPEDVSVELLPGRKSHNITLSAPVTNSENWKVKPNWVSVENPVQFPVGTTSIVFTASIPNIKRVARCTTTVNVIDKEEPVFHFCPEPIEINDVGLDGVSVTWKEPLVTDNVKVESVETTLEPNSILPPGTYNVDYLARDAAGNIATCSFKIAVKRMQCDDLDDPENGAANCMHWMSGKVCSPSCNTGYIRHPNDTLFYSCDDSGVWVPEKVISKCLKTLPITSSTCPDDYEIIEIEETGEKMCAECRENTVWSASTRQCEELEDLQDYNIS